MRKPFHPLYVGMSKTFLLGLSGAFDVNASANCSADFIVYTGNAAGGTNQQGIVAGKDLCSGLQQSKDGHPASEVRWLSADER